MLRTTALALLAASTSFCAINNHATAQCQTWKSGWHLPGTDADVTSCIEFNDGGGATLFVGGLFTSAGPITANRIAKWNGSSWSTVGAGFNSTVSCFAVSDVEGLPSLYAGGSFTQSGVTNIASVARLAGSQWAPLGNGPGGSVSALASFDDGAGTALYAATSASGFSNTVARWNGIAWSTLGSGFNNLVTSLTVFNDGGGQALYAAGFFTAIGGNPADRIAKWNGTTWVALGTGVNAGISALAVHDDGSGAALYAGGDFTMAGGLLASRIARWSGSFWTPVGSGADNSVLALTVADVGSGPRLFAGGRFLSVGANAASRVAMWDGTAWNAVGLGISGTNPEVRTLCATVGLGNARLWAGGRFATAGSAGASNVASWSGTKWNGVAGNGIANGEVHALAALDDGFGPALYAGGQFYAAGSSAARGIAKWDGEKWKSLSSGIVGDVRALARFDDGIGQQIVAAGSLTSAGGTTVSNVAQWNGSTWSALGAGTSSTVNALASFDDGSGVALYAGGSFATAGGVSVSNVARWDGTGWSAAGTGMGLVNALMVYDDGLGARLYAAGILTAFNAWGVARLDGTAWTLVGSLLPTWANALVAHDDGTGPTMYVGGGFGTFSSGYVAKFTSGDWQFVGGSTGSVLTLASGRSGSTSYLYAGGDFTNGSFGLGFNEGLARWDGSTWFEMTAARRVSALCDFDDGSGLGRDIYAGGLFAQQGLIPSSNIAAWEQCTLSGVPFCFGDDIDPVVNIPCPCAPPNTVPNPPAAPGHGCANSLNLDGARLDATGTTVPDTLAFRTHVAPLYVGFAFMVKGNAVTPTGIAASDGIRCANGALLRFGGHMAGTNGSPVGQWTYPNTAQTTPVSVVTSQALGQSAYYQLFYRNSTPNFCNSATANFSNAYQIVWQ